MARTLREASGPEPLPDSTERDLFAFLALGLAELAGSVETTALAWEKRSYWLKADRFRQEWEWVGQIQPRLDLALTSSDWDEARRCGMELATVLGARKLKTGSKAGTPWRGAWSAWASRNGRSA
jgi:hypothetical protein